MKVRTGNYLTEVGVFETIELFQHTAYQILFGNYIKEKFKKEGSVHNYKELIEVHKVENFPYIRMYDICYYRIIKSEATSIVQFLNSGLELICGVETQPEEEKF